MTVSVGPSLIAAIGLTGHNGTGAISAPGVKVGDYLISAFWTRPASPTRIDPYTSLEGVVSVDDEIQQIENSDFSSSGVINIFLVRLP
jgi:hypothetical protein